MTIREYLYASEQLPVDEAIRRNSVDLPTLDEIDSIEAYEARMRNLMIFYISERL
jgi:hypothetical protein